MRKKKYTPQRLRKMRKEEIIRQAIVPVLVVVIFLCILLGRPGRPVEIPPAHSSSASSEVSSSGAASGSASGSGSEEKTPDKSGSASGSDTSGAATPSKTENPSDKPTVSAQSPQTEKPPAKTENPPAKTEKPPAKTETPPAKTEKPAANAQKRDKLFIGDSRTVGIRDYGHVTNADFFCDVGMSTFNIKQKEISVRGVGKVGLNKLLSKVSYKKIYVMLGINEIGYSRSSVLKKYAALVDELKAKQPNATIIVQANLHVTKERAEKSKTINNVSIGALNDELKKMAQGKGVHFLDANVVFDDANGNLTAKKSTDGVHLYGLYYDEWGKWIESKTNSL